MLVTYFMLILTLAPNNDFPEGKEIVLPFEELRVCTLASKDLLGYLDPKQCKGYVMNELLKMSDPNYHPKPLPRPKDLFEEIE